MTATPPPESFRIGTLGRWFLVHIAPSLRDMHDTMKAHVGGCSDTLTAAVVMIRGDDDFETCAGFVFFAKPRLGAGLVAHELAHCAFRIMELSNMRVEHWNRAFIGDEPTKSATDASEETYCAVVETLTRDFWAKAYEHGYA